MPHVVTTPDGRTYTFPDTMSVEGMRKAMVAATGGGAPVDASRGAKDWSGGGGRSLGRMAVDAIPSAFGIGGDILGGLAGAPLGPAGTYGGAVLGSALAAAPGEFVRQEVSRALGFPAPRNARESLEGMGRASATQGIATAVGRPLGSLMTKAGGALMRSALNPGIPVQNKAIQAAGGVVGRTSPEDASLAEQALKERVGVGGPIGSKATVAKRDVAMGARSNILAGLAKAGNKNTIPDIMQPVADLREELSHQTDWVTLEPKFNKMVESFTAPYREKLPNGRLGKWRDLSPTELEVLKETWAKQAEKLYRARGRGSSTLDMKTRFNAAVARGAREALEQQDPNIGLLNRRYSTLGPLLEAQLRAEGRSLPPAGLSLRGLGRLMGMESPGLQSRAALALTSDPAQSIVPQLPRGAAWWLLPPPDEPPHESPGSYAGP